MFDLAGLSLSWLVNKGIGHQLRGGGGYIMGGGWASEVLPLQKKGWGGGAEKVSAIMKGRGGGGAQSVGVVLTQVLEVLSILEGHKVSTL